MADSHYEVLRISFEFKKDWTEVEVICGPTSDGMIGIQGLHKKVFPKERDVLSILQTEIVAQDYLTW